MYAARNNWIAYIIWRPVLVIGMIVVIVIDQQVTYPLIDYLIDYWIDQLIAWLLMILRQNYIHYKSWNLAYIPRNLRSAGPFNKKSYLT